MLLCLVIRRSTNRTAKASESNQLNLEELHECTGDCTTSIRSLAGVRRVARRVETASQLHRLFYWRQRTHEKV